jgi:hypothetical protein
VSGENRTLLAYAGADSRKDSFQQAVVKRNSRGRMSERRLTWQSGSSERLVEKTKGSRRDRRGARLGVPDVLVKQRIRCFDECRALVSYQWAGEECSCGKVSPARANGWAR